MIMSLFPAIEPSELTSSSTCRWERSNLTSATSGFASRLGSLALSYSLAALLERLHGEIIRQCTETSVSGSAVFSLFSVSFFLLDHSVELRPPLFTHRLV